MDTPLQALTLPRDVPGQESIPLIGSDGAPNPPIMKHLLDVFLVHFGCQYPFISRADLEPKIESGTGSVFLLNSIAAIAARCVMTRVLLQAVLILGSPLTRL